MKELHRGASGLEVSRLQRANNTRSENMPERRIPRVVVDGDLGPRTLEAVEISGRALGALESTLREVRAGKVPVGLQRMIREPENRSAVQLQRAADRKVAAEKAEASTPLMTKAWQEAGRDLDVREVGRNNAGSRVAQIIREGGGNPNQYPAWCAYAVAAWYRRAGSTVDWTGTWGAVRRMHLPAGVKVTRSPKRGALVRFKFDHIGLFGGWCDSRGRSRPRLLATHIRSREANTGSTGAVSDSAGGGDGVREKIRARSLVSDYLEVTR